MGSRKQFQMSTNHRSIWENSTWGSLSEVLTVVSKKTFCSDLFLQFDLWKWEAQEVQNDQVISKIFLIQARTLLQGARTCKDQSSMSVFVRALRGFRVSPVHRLACSSYFPKVVGTLVVSQDWEIKHKSDLCLISQSWDTTSDKS